MDVAAGEISKPEKLRPAPAAEKEAPAEKWQVEKTVAWGGGGRQKLKLAAGVIVATMVVAVGVYFSIGGVSRAGQMTTEQVMEMVPQSTSLISYIDLNTMRETPALQGLYDSIFSQGSFVDLNSIDYMVSTNDLMVFGGGADIEEFKTLYENYFVASEEYKGYQIFGYMGFVTAPQNGSENYNSGLAKVGDKVVSGEITAVRDFIDVLEGDKPSMYENSAYDELKTEITGGFIIQIGRTLLPVHGERLLGYSVSQADGSMARVKAAYVYDNQDGATGAFVGLENYVQTYWTNGSGAVLEQRGKAIVITIASPIQNIIDILGWVVGSTGISTQITPGPPPLPDNNP